MNGVEVSGNKESVANGQGEIVEYEMTEAGRVVITATQADYLGFVGVLFKTLEMKKAGAIASLEAAYPPANYTQNADYATVLAAQKALLEAAADEAALKVAYDAAVVAMDALEVDKEEDVDLPEYAETYSYVFAEVSGDYEASAAINSNEYVTFAGCVKHDGTYIALKENNSVSINVAAGATLKVHMPYSSGITLNGEAYTLVDDYLTYTATTNETVVITGTAGKSYITSITVTIAE